ncbi:MAG: hypothetical protein WD513_07790 [Balneolaceae bacterium]
MKYITLLTTFVFFFSVNTYSQSLTVSPASEHAGYSENTFPIYHSTLTLNRNMIKVGEVDIVNPITWSYSDEGLKVAFLQQKDQVYLTNYDASGVQLIDRSLEFFDNSDQTLRVYPFDDGRVIIRDNVANFTFFNAMGEQIYSVSNSSQSSDGERESELAADDMGQTIVLYNPLIVYGSDTGSRARIVYGENRNLVFYSDLEREISQLKVTDDGSYITLVTTDGNRQTVLIYDRFGNEIYRYVTDDDLLGVTISTDAEYITKYTSGRVQTFHITSGEVIGSTSTRGSIVTAYYFPEDEMIVALGGTISNRNLTNPTITAVHLGRREIVREDVSGPLSSIKPDEIEIVREYEGQFRIIGLNQHLEVSAGF